MLAPGPEAERGTLQGPFQTEGQQEKAVVITAFQPPVKILSEKKHTLEAYAGG